MTSESNNFDVENGKLVESSENEDANFEEDLKFEE